MTKNDNDEMVKVLLFNTNELLAIVQALAELKPKSSLFEDWKKSVQFKIREALGFGAESQAPKQGAGDPFPLYFRCPECAQVFRVTEETGHPCRPINMDSM